jgi:hypothetical protein
MKNQPDFIITCCNLQNIVEKTLAAIIEKRPAAAIMPSNEADTIIKIR